MSELGVEAKAERYDKLFEEVMNSFRISLDKMRDIAAEGKGTEHESKTNPLYNRYFGCAIAMNSLLKGFFKENLPEEMQKEAEAEEGVEAGDSVDASKN